MVKPYLWLQTISSHYFLIFIKSLGLQVCSSSLSVCSMVPRDPFPILAQLWWWTSEKKEWSQFHHSFCSKSTPDLFPSHFIEFICSSFLAGFGLFVRQHLADVVWTELHMLVCSTKTLKCSQKKYE